MNKIFFIILAVFIVYIILKNDKTKQVLGIKKPGHPVQDNVKKGTIQPKKYKTF
jgi:hypothetical protein